MGRLKASVEAQQAEEAWKKRTLAAQCLFNTLYLRSLKRYSTDLKRIRRRQQKEASSGRE